MFSYFITKETRQKKHKNSVQNSGSSNTGTGTNQSKQPLVCFSYGEPENQSIKIKIKSINQSQSQCSLCHQTGHFKSFCHSKGQSSTPGGGRHQKRGPSCFNKCLHFPTRRVNDIKSMDAQTPSLASPIFGTVQLDCQGFTSKFDLKAEVDLGSHCTIVTHSIFDSDFPNNVLHDLQCPIFNFDGSEIDVIEGYFWTTAFFNGQQYSTSIYIADNGCKSVIGYDLLSLLGLTVEFSLHTVHHTEPDLNAQQFEQSSEWSTTNLPLASMAHLGKTWAIDGHKGTG